MATSFVDDLRMAAENLEASIELIERLPGRRWSKSPNTHGNRPRVG